LDCAEIVSCVSPDEPAGFVPALVVVVDAGFRLAIADVAGWRVPPEHAPTIAAPARISARMKVS